MDVHLKESCGGKSPHTHVHLTESCGEHAQAHTHCDISASFSIPVVVGSAASLPTLAFSLAKTHLCLKLTVSYGERQTKMHRVGI